MKKTVLESVNLPPLDSIFSTEEQRQDDLRERITHVLISELHQFPDHPFKVPDDDKMLEMAESIRDYGVLTPLMLRVPKACPPLSGLFSTLLYTICWAVRKALSQHIVFV